MSVEHDKNDFSKIINEANERGLIKSYSKFCETEDAKKYALSEDEVKYYTSLNKEHFKIGDIVFVSNYTYKNGEK